MATPADRDQVTATVAAAFRADPAFRYFFPDDRTYPELAARFAGHLFDARIDHGAVWVVENGRAVAMWDRPGSPGHADLDLPEDVALRLATYDSAVHSGLPDSPHWYLGVLATDPGHTRQGWGRRLLETGLREAAADHVRAYLETTNSDNVRYYRTIGWQVDSERTVGSLTVRVMRHEGLADTRRVT